jgi:uncharacterized membrane protein YphA (DoxX/SURF4 family)
MKFEGKKIGYWVATALLALGFLAAGASDLAHAPQVMESLASLGYPAYFASILGVWKVLGALAIVVPKFPRLKEWAYAGIAFDLSGAFLSHLICGQGDKVAAPIVLLLVAAASWALRPPSRKLLADDSAQAAAANGSRVGEVARA